MTINAFDFNDPDHVLAYRMGHFHAAHGLSADPMQGHQMRQLVGPVVDLTAGRVAVLCAAFVVAHRHERDRQAALSAGREVEAVQGDDYTRTEDVMPHLLRTGMTFQSRLLPGARAAFVYVVTGPVVEHSGASEVSVMVQGYPTVAFLSRRRPVAVYQDPS